MFTQPYMLTEHIGLLFVKKHHINLYKTKKLHIFAARNRKTYTICALRNISKRLQESCKRLRKTRDVAQSG